MADRPVSTGLESQLCGRVGLEDWRSKAELLSQNKGTKGAGEVALL